MEQKKRPVFLTVLCILSYVGLGWSILNGLICLITSNFARSFAPMLKRFSHIAEHTSSDPVSNKWMQGLGSFAENALEQAFNINLTYVLLSLVAFLGVFLMWQLKKSGFYLYSIAKIFIICTPIIYLGMNLITGIIAISGGFFALIFIVLYATNLKYLT